MINILLLAVKEISENLDLIERALRGVEEMYTSFSRSALDVKSKWDSTYPKLVIRLRQLEQYLDASSMEMEALRIKRELNLIDEEAYNRLVSEYEQRIGEVRDSVNKLRARLDDIDLRVRLMWIRALTIEILRDMDFEELERRIEEMRASNRIDEATYNRLIHELRLMMGVRELLELAYKHPSG